MDDGGGGVRAGCIRIRCPSPRRIMSRWLATHRNKVTGNKTAMSESRVRDCSNAEKIINCSDDGHGIDEFTDLPPRSVDIELQRKEFLFSIGVSCYLLHLIATGREEIHKIMELRNDLEKFIECKNHELRRKQLEFVELRNNIEKFLACQNNDEPRREQSETKTSAYSTTRDVVVDGQESSTDNYYSPQFLETSLSIGQEGSFKHYVFKEGEMDQLEAELEAEFEILQIGHGQECPEIRHMCSSGQVDHEEQGVCPYELEKRLHELIEARQEEEIKELESALGDAKRRLHVKESEATWWRETAYIVSEHVPEPSRITLTHLFPLSR